MAQQAKFSRPIAHAALPQSAAPRPSGNGSRPSSVDQEERQRMIEEAAYQRFAQRGFVHGYDVEDWLMAEADVDRMIANNSNQSEPTEMPEERELQQGASRSIIRNETMKRILKQHPLRDTPKV